MNSYRKKFVLALLFSMQVLLALVMGCNATSRVESAIASKTSTATGPIIAPSGTPTSILVVPLSPTSKATIQPEESTLQWCDDFEDGIIDQSKWNMPTDSSLIYERNGVLNFRVIEEQSHDQEAWAGLEALQTDKLIREVSYMITLDSHGTDTPGGVGIDIFLKDADPMFSVDIGPGPSGPGAEFSFCPNFNAGYEECQHPTPVPNESSIPVIAEDSMDFHIIGTGDNIEFNIDGQRRAGQAVNAPIENFQFFIYADPGSTLHVLIDNVCVTYGNN